MSDEPAFHSSRFETAPENIVRRTKKFNLLQLGFFFGMGQSFQIGRDGGIGVLKRIFLAPLNDGGRADPLHNPMIDRAVWASVQQDVGNIAANRESRIRWLGGQLRSDQLNRSF